MAKGFVWGGILGLSIGVGITIGSWKMGLLPGGYEKVSPLLPISSPMSDVISNTTTRTVLRGGFHVNHPRVKITIDNESPVVSFWQIDRQGIDLSQPYTLPNDLKAHLLDHLTLYDLTVQDTNKWIVSEVNSEGFVSLSTSGSSIRFNLYTDMIVDGSLMMTELRQYPEWFPSFVKQ